MMVRPAAVLALLAAFSCIVVDATGGGRDRERLSMNKSTGYNDTDSEEPFAFEVLAAKPSAQLLFATAKEGGMILRWDDSGNLEEVSRFTETEDDAPTSVAYCPKGDMLAVSVAPDDVLVEGSLIVISSVEQWEACDFCTEIEMTVLSTGFHPDMVTFTPNCEYILVANEGEPEDYTAEDNDPEGSISIYALDSDSGKFAEPCTADFTRFNDEDLTKDLMESGVRVTGVNTTTFSQDMEPEYIAVSRDSKWAYVTLQENNAVAKIDIEGCTVEGVYPLGYKDWEANGWGFDASDKDDGINLQAWPGIKAMYMPDAIAAFEVGGETYLVIANEGDSREYGDEDEAGYYEDATRIEDIAALLLDLDDDEDAPAPYDDDNFGRLEVSNVFPFEDDLDELFMFGGRSISILDSEANVVWDSGDFMETYTADEANGFAEFFNSEGTEDSFDDRSDKRGVEPEGVTVAVIYGRTFVFVGLERLGGWMCWDISDPTSPEFQTYINPLNEDGDAIVDFDPETSVFIPAEYGVDGKPLLIAAYPGSYALAVFEINLSDGGKGHGGGLRGHGGGGH